VASACGPDYPDQLAGLDPEAHLVEHAATLTLTIFEGHP
jgi:hypothetical protein